MRARIGTNHDGGARTRRPVRRVRAASEVDAEVDAETVSEGSRKAT
ncbi:MULTISPECIES: hypothetical protein [unclassified Nonomuraea]